LGSLPPQFNLLEIQLRIKESNPYIIVAVQECERMNTLMHEIRSSLHDLDQGLKGNLNITDAMEALSGCLKVNQVPPLWVKSAYPSNKMLQEWFADLIQRTA
jgi:dynein heavy chain